MTSHLRHRPRPRPRPTIAASLIHPYDPWADLRQNWPHVKVVIEEMAGDLLGEVRDDGQLIALRADTSAAQRRCTLTHELVHLERGILDCGPWLQREEGLVHAEVSRRLIPLASARRFGRWAEPTIPRRSRNGSTWTAKRWRSASHG